MVRKLFGFGKKKKTPDDSTWNEIGRDVATRNSNAIAAFHEGQSESVNLADDLRDPEVAEAVLQYVVQLNLEGRGAEARSKFDPAHAPFITELENGGRGLTCCAIIGPDEFLVQQGTTYQENTTWHIKGNDIRPVENISSFAWSRNREHFLTVFQDGQLALSKGFGITEAEKIPSIPSTAFIPEGLSAEYLARFAKPSNNAAYSRVSVSNDGNRILLCDEERGILLLHRQSEEWKTTLLYPSLELGLKDEKDDNWDEEEEFSPYLDMIHSALSPCGRFAALGTQNDGHHIFRLDNATSPSVHAQLGYLSEYPHNACFDDNSKFVAFNSCHFYHGVTFASKLSDVEGLTTEPYEPHNVQTILNNYLRVYASGFLPASMTEKQTGAFLLAGSGFASCVTPDGSMVWELGFGSSAGAVDVCPITKRVLIASYSGILHLIDPSLSQSPMIFSGYKAPQELRRWLFWDRLDQPIVW